MKTPNKKTKATSDSEKKTAVHTPTPPQVVYPLEKPDSKKNKEHTTGDSKTKKDN
ncbi:MAG: hypothetical protein K0R51_1674 [Cytophagaceae bacterium]|jgi:hypothetical protein|nr:hypothetical protein [Cytophagaceae bacterium]